MNITTKLFLSNLVFAAFVILVGFIPIFVGEEYNVIIISIGLAFIAMIFGYFMKQSIISPLKKLTDVSVKIAKGDFDNKIEVKGNDEIYELSQSMKKMQESIKISFENEQELFIAKQQFEVDDTVAKAKEEFVAMITHDLKQPLVLISGYADMLRNSQMVELNEMQKEYLDEILVNARHQLSMIDNLVSAQKLGAGAIKYDIEELSSKAILNDCINIHTPIMSDKKIEYFDSSTEDFKIKGDKRRILESFTNLIQNSHDFVPDNGKIEIGVTSGDKEVTFFVKDNGEGIPKEKQDKLFKKYGQVESTAERKFGGTGLGLAVSQELIEGMGGRIWFESEEGQGTTFFFTIPKAD